MKIEKNDNNFTWLKFIEMFSIDAKNVITIKKDKNNFDHFSVTIQLIN